MTKISLVMPISSLLIMIDPFGLLVNLPLQTISIEACRRRLCNNFFRIRS
uniref:Uncharacterized protein n=1 Tax=Utricularia reniformis TaxID=192314 RepID=A0A1Y0B4K0_9LAMI|nr:hypothetical protein AEK19_MT2170 [Utricularia reniformis]ART32318.1 hypothetical protein AEK19_MT2170 [Utricularia reniformis]